jgi:predicted exporter
LTTRQAGIVTLWLCLITASIWIIVGPTRFSSDITAFLPSAVNREHQLLIQQLREGLASRLILIALEAAPPERLAEYSRALAARLQKTGLFSLVNNGAAQFLERERHLLLRFRYLLSPTVVPEQFSREGLRQGLEQALQMLASPAGPLIKATLPQDPTGEIPRLFALLATDDGPTSRHGVWFSHDGARALLIAQTTAQGFDIDRQQVVLDRIRQAFGSIAGEQARVLLSGPAVFAVEARAAIEQDAWRLSVVSSVLVVVILLSIYRSFIVLLLAFLPVASGLLVGIAAVGLGFDAVHGITLGFGATLIGEAVDYPSYLFSHVAHGERVEETAARLGPTLGLAVLTTVFGATAMLLSSFTGLAQLGLLTMTGVLVAGWTTRFLLPLLAPYGFSPQLVAVLPKALFALVRLASRGAWVIGVLLAAAACLLAVQYPNLWNDDLARLSPVPEQAMALDEALRSELGAPDVRQAVIVLGATAEQALVHSEHIEPWLQQEVQAHVITGYELAAAYLPSRARQAERRAALPDAATLRENLNHALHGLPFRPGLFEPFLRDVESTRTGPLLSLPDLSGSALAFKIETLVFKHEGQWIALIPLRGVRDIAQLAADARALPSFATLLDLKAESDQLVQGYRREAMLFAGLGILAISFVLLCGLKHPATVLRVLVPVLIAVVLDVAGLWLVGERLNVFHLVALLLVVGIGLNYALFFNRQAQDREDRARTALALAVCLSTTLSAFGCLAASRMPVLHAIGVTVSGGALLALVCAAMLAPKQDHR